MSSAPGPPGPTEAGVWHRLHPLSPIARIGRLVPVIVFALIVSISRSGSNDGFANYAYVIIVVVITPILGVIHWLVTRWTIEGDTLRIETGLIRRDSRRLPLTRIQAVDIVRPLMARILGVSELRIRLAGSGSTDGRLAYLSETAAVELRQRLLTGTGDSSSTASPTAATRAPERLMVAVGTGRLVASILLSWTVVFLLALVTALVILLIVSPKAGASVAAASAVYLFGFANGLWRRASSEFHFEAVEAVEGIRIRRGLLATVSETVPLGRIQAVRNIEPLLWRPLGWCRLEVDIAGGGGRNQRGEGGGVARKALLPVGTQQDAWHLLERVIGGSSPTLSAPPPQARWKSPLSFHHLAAGHDDLRAVGVTGRLRRVTSWVPLEKSQSIRRVQGPVQRRLGLATVHVDAAGKQVRAVFRDRGLEEAERLVDTLTTLSRAARMHHTAVPAERVPATQVEVPPGWYPDPAGRHELRYWDGERWSAQVSDRGTTTVDSP